MFPANEAHHIFVPMDVVLTQINSFYIFFETFFRPKYSPKHKVGHIRMLVPAISEKHFCTMTSLAKASINSHTCFTSHTSQLDSLSPQLVVSVLSHLSCTSETLGYQHREAHTTYSTTTTKSIVYTLPLLYSLNQTTNGGL